MTNQTQTLNPIRARDPNAHRLTATGRRVVCPGQYLPAALADLDMSHFINVNVPSTTDEIPKVTTPAIAGLSNQLEAAPSEVLEEPWDRPKNQCDADEVFRVRSKYKLAISSLPGAHPKRASRTASGYPSRTCSVCAPIRKECDVNLPWRGVGA